MFQGYGQGKNSFDTELIQRKVVMPATIPYCLATHDVKAKTRQETKIYFTQLRDMMQIEKKRKEIYLHK